LRVAAVTTWPPHRDGVALYVSRLYSHIAKSEKVGIIANFSKSPSKEVNDGIAVFRCWKRNSPFYILQILKKALSSDAYVFHVQHGWLLYGNAFVSSLFPMLLLALKPSGIPIVTTMHTVALRKAKMYGNSFLDMLGHVGTLVLTKAIAKLSIIVVHNNLMKQVLQTEYGIEGNRIVIIPHGVTDAPKEPLTESEKEAENLQILSLGFLRRGKGLEILVEAFENLRKNHEKMKLVVVGGAHSHDEKSYVNELLKSATHYGRERIFFENFVDEDRLNGVILESDIIVLLSEEGRFVESSGALARVADFSKPVICSRVPKFLSELKDGANCLTTENTVESLTRTLELLVGDHELRVKMASNLKRDFNARHWDDTAAKHVELYKGLRVMESSSR